MKTWVDDSDVSTMAKTSARPVNVRMLLDELTVNRRDFIEWMLDPSIPKPHGAQKQWALDHGLNPSTLKNWKKEPKFHRAWTAATMERSLSPDKVARLVDWMFNRVVEANDRNMAMQLLRFIEQWTPRASVEIRHPGELAVVPLDRLLQIIEEERANEQGQSELDPR